jgi:glycerol-3-phosphate O-acyltransferase
MTDASPWPERASDVAFLLEANGAFERRLLAEWVNRTRPSGVREPYLVSLPCSRRGQAERLDPKLEEICAAGDDITLSPLRVAWLPEERNGGRRARPADLVLGDPRDPGAIRGRWIHYRDPSRVQLVAAEPATVGELRGRWRARGLSETTGLAPFVYRQAVLALERSERRLRGARYKVPRLVRSEILERPKFRAALSRIAAETGRTADDVARDATSCLAEMSAAHSPFMMDLLGSFFEFIFSRGYEGPPDYDAAALERLVAITEKTPVAFVFSHRSHLDGMAMYSMLHRERLPPSHLVGGDNMAVFPLGLLARRSGAVFIRRSFKDDPVYKATIRQYVDYLLEKRFSLSWAIEGTRSRSGKLMPPRLGLLAWVVDSWRRRCVDDVVFVPVSISYDQIVELADYAAEQRGGKKRAESTSWLVGFISGIQAPHGKMYVRFGEALSLADYFGSRSEEAASDPSAGPTLDLQKLAFELSVRINQATLVTPSALLSMVLLANGPRALSLAEVTAETADLQSFAETRGLPGASDLQLDAEPGVRAALDSLARGGVVTCHEDGPEAVFAITEGKQLAGAYYRNCVLHFFLSAAIAELALVAVAEANVPVTRDVILAEVSALRDLLKFEFFFPERAVFEAEVIEEIARTDPEWETTLRPGREAIRGWFDQRHPLVAHGTLRPFVEGYAIVAEELARQPAGASVEANALVGACLGLGLQRVRQGRITSHDAVTRETIKTGLELAEHRGLVAAEKSDDFSRAALLESTRALRRRIDMVARLAARRHADPFS